MHRHIFKGKTKIPSILSIGFLVFLLLFSKDAIGFDWVKVHQKALKMSADRKFDETEYVNGKKEGYYLLGLVSLEANELEKAKGAFSKILQNDATSVEAKWGLAEILRRQNKREKSEKILEWIISEYENYAPAYISLSSIKYSNLDFEESTRLAEHVISLPEVDEKNLTKAYGLFGRAKAMMAYHGNLLGKLKEGFNAIPLLRKAEAFYPNNPDILLGLGTCYMVIPRTFGRDLQLAQKYLLKVTRINPSNLEAHIRLAQIYKFQNKIELHKQYLEQASKIDPNNEIILDVINGICNYVCLH